MTQWQFDMETAVVEHSSGRYRTHLHPAWNIGDKPNGGYAAASLIRAMAQLAGREDPVTVTTHYLRPGVAGQDAEIRTELVRSGRRTVNTAASLHQDGKERLRCLAAFGDLSDAADAGRPTLSLPPVQLAPPEHCHTRSGEDQGIDLPINSRLELRMAPEYAEPGAAGRAEIAGWVRFLDGRPTDAAALPLFADAFPPAVFSLLGRVGWVPTLELTVQVRRRPAPGWIAARFHTQDLHNGLLVEDGELWDETGALVARSRQLAMLLEG
ncbi:MAG: thioesterase family protein [Ectothiorhodospiraceae bacterium]|nr:thioesterase family protein [Ectothiorhodospiraceae bacterium]